jgi:hypothetical protein
MLECPSHSGGRLDTGKLDSDQYSRLDGRASKLARLGTLGLGLGLAWTCTSGNRRKQFKDQLPSRITHAEAAVKTEKNQCFIQLNTLF